MALAESTVEVKSSAEAYDLVAEDYDLSYSDRKSEAEDRFIFDYLYRRGCLRGSVLDVGCGTGVLLDKVSEIPPCYEMRYLGIDPSRGMLRQARSKHPAEEFRIGSAEAIPFSSGLIRRYVSLYGSFNYCMQPIRAVKEAARVLAPGGRLFIMVCGYAHLRRSSYLMNRVGIVVARQLYRVESLRLLFNVPEFRDARVWSFGNWLDRLPLTAPSWMFDLVMQTEAARTSVRAMDKCPYLVVEATRS